MLIISFRRGSSRQIWRSGGGFAASFCGFHTGHGGDYLGGGLELADRNIFFSDGSIHSKATLARRLPICAMDPGTLCALAAGLQEPLTGFPFEPA